MLAPTEIKQKLKMAFWDYNYNPEDLYNVLYNDAEIQYLSKERIYQRLLETYSWYKILEIVPQNQLLNLLEEDVLKKLRFQQLKNRYKNVRELLLS